MPGTSTVHLLAHYLLVYRQAGCLHLLANDLSRQGKPPPFSPFQIVNHRTCLRCAGVPCNGCACFDCGNTPDATALSVKRYRAIVTSETGRSRQSQSTKETFTKAISGKPAVCHCKNSNCLKLYCICFKEGKSACLFRLLFVVHLPCSTLRMI